MLEAQDVKFRNLSCNVSHPIYREKTRTVIHLLFGVLVNGSWGERLDMEATVSSDNEETGTLGNNKAVLSFPIQYPISIIAIGLDNSTQYMNFTSQLQNQTMRHSYQVKNMQLGLFPAPSLQVYLMASMKLTLGLAWQVESVETDSAEPCTSVDMARETPETAAIRSRRKTINQYSAHEYKIFRCNISQINTSLIHINGVVSVPKKIEKSSRSLFCTTLWFTFDTKRYTHLSSEITESQIITEVELVYVMNYLPIYIGSSIGGLFLLVLIVFVLYKLGFFKRSYKERRDHEPNAKNGVGAAEDGVGAAADAAGSGEDGECSVPLDENKED
uniref:Integrin alpha-X-like third Ig-like domain-containing protein n=1 Tax=Sphenodon punctatus TaxID=8508 RepID=A0A8D0H385_SPHPU